MIYPTHLFDTKNDDQLFSLILWIQNMILNTVTYQEASKVNHILHNVFLFFSNAN